MVQTELLCPEKQIVSYPGYPEQCRVWQPPDEPERLMFNGRSVMLYTDAGRQMGQDMSFDQVVGLVNQVSAFTREHAYMASKSTHELMPYVMSSHAYPLVTWTQTGPEFVAFAKLNPWDISTVAEVFPTDSRFVELSDQQMIEVSTFIVNPYDDPIYKGGGLSSSYITQVLRCAADRYPGVPLFAVVQDGNDRARDYFLKMGGRLAARFSYDPAVAERVPGDKLLISLNPILEESKRC